MLLKLIKNMLLMNIFFFPGSTNIVYADECGVLRYLANKSSGITVFGNSCGEVGYIALGSEFNLMPGARLWFKSQMGAEAKKTQGICQNRSAKSIRVSVNSVNPPWIKPSGLAKCSSWTDDKMDCIISKGGQNALSCVIATVDSEQRPNDPEERTTSVRMRSLPMIDESDKTELPQNGEETGKEQIVLAMQPDIDLCRAVNGADAPVKVDWQVETNGRANTVISVVDESGAQNDADKLFIDCLTAVIKDFSYPQASQAIWLSNQF